MFGFSCAATPAARATERGSRYEQPFPDAAGSRAGRAFQADHRGATMKTTATQHAMAVRLAGALALTAAPSAFAQIRPGAERGITTVAQFCVPPESPDAHRFYCRHSGG
jgi:hypothetical protein